MPGESALSWAPLRNASCAGFSAPTWAIDRLFIAAVLSDCR